MISNQKKSLKPKTKKKNKLLDENKIFTSYWMKIKFLQVTLLQSKTSNFHD